MDELRELVSIVTKQKLKAAAMLSVKALQPGPLSMRLYDLVTDGKVKTDEEAMAVLFPGETRTVSYLRIRKSLRDYLVRMLFVIDLHLPNYSTRQKAYFDCHKDWAAIKILVGKNAHRSTLALAAEVLRTALRFDLVELALDVTRTLRLYYGSIEGDLKKYEQYGKQVRHLEEVFRYENLAEEYYTDLVIRFVNDKSTKKDVAQLAKKYFSQLEKALDQYDSYRLHFTGRLIEIMIYTSINDYKKTIDICDKAIRFFESKSYEAKIPSRLFSTRKWCATCNCATTPADAKRPTAGSNYWKTAPSTGSNTRNCSSCSPCTPANTRKHTKFIKSPYNTGASTACPAGSNKPGKYSKPTCSTSSM
jgi:head-tail adaptor